VNKSGNEVKPISPLIKNDKRINDIRTTVSISNTGEDI